MTEYPSEIPLLLSSRPIPAMAEIDQCDIHGIRACANHLDSAVIRGQLMVGVAKQRNRNAVFFGNPLRYPRNRTGIRVNINSQTITSQYLQRHPIQVVAGNQPVHDSHSFAGISYHGFSRPVHEAGPELSVLTENGDEDLRSQTNS